MLHEQFILTLILFHVGCADDFTAEYYFVAVLNLLKWIALEPDYEYLLRHVFLLYIVSKRDQTNDIHLSGLST